MKILLINPPQTIPDSHQFYFSIPLGLMSVATVLQKENFSVKIFDSLVENFEVSRTGGFSQCGASFDSIKNAIRRERPDIVGVSNPFFSQLKNAVECCNAAKEVDKGIITVAGGPHVSAFPAEVLKENKGIDISVFGEGEYSMLDIARQFSGKKPDFAGIRGIAYRDNKKVKRNKPREPIYNLDELPFPAYGLVDMEKYFGRPYLFYGRGLPKKRALPIITSRGCPYNCIFCSIAPSMGRIWRANSPDYVIGHIRHVVENFGVEHIHFEDDNLMLSRPRIAEILDRLIAENLNISWSTPNGVRADSLDEGLIAKCKKSNCTRLVIGVESGNQRVLDTIVKKGLELEKAVKAAELCKKHGVNLHAFFVIGFPGEKIREMNETIDFALRLFRKFDVKPNLYIANPLPGTELQRQCQEKGYIDKLQQLDFAVGSLPDGKHLIHTSDFSRSDIDKIVKRFNRSLALTAVFNPKNWPLVLREINKRALGFAFRKLH